MTIHHVPSITVTEPAFLSLCTTSRMFIFLWTCDRRAQRGRSEVFIAAELILFLH
jgi:hypothetical protein